MPTHDQLIQAARAAAKNAYAPYSNFPVGAALVMADDPSATVHTGANVENASYGATVCAERTAIHYTVSLGFRKIDTIAITVTNNLDNPLADRSPCGICRQVIHEFATPDTLILLDNNTATPDTLTIAELLPHGFSLD